MTPEPKIETCQLEARTAKTKVKELQAHIDRLLDERTKMNESWNDRCKSAELKLRLMTEAFEAAHTCADDCLAGCCYDPR